MLSHIAGHGALQIRSRLEESDAVTIPPAVINQSQPKSTSRLVPSSSWDVSSLAEVSSSVGQLSAQPP